MTETTTFSHNGVNVKMTVRTHSFTEHYLTCNDFEEHWMLNWIEQNIKRKGVWIDAGANVGNHSVHFSMFGSADIVIPIEPVIDNFYLMQKNLIQNNCKNTIPIMAGVLDTCHFASFTKHPEHADTLYVYTKGGNTPIITIDSLGLKDISLIKLDVEGMEIPALKGAKETLINDKPELFLEAFEKETIEAHTNFLAEFGYRYVMPFNHGWMHYYTAL